MSGRLADGGGDPLVDLVDDETIDAIVDGDPVDPRFDYLAAFAEEARALGDRPPPRPSAALAALIEQGGSPGDRTLSVVRSLPVARRRPGRTLVAARVAGIGLVAKVALAASVGTAGVAAAGATGVLPDPATRQVRQAIEVTTPFEFREPATDPAPDRPPGDRDAGTVDGPGEAPGTGQPPAAEPGEPQGVERDARTEPGRDDPGEQQRKPPEPQEGRSAKRPTPGEDRPGESDDPGEPGKGKAGNGQGQEPTGSKPSDDKAPGKPE